MKNLLFLTIFLCLLIWSCKDDIDTTTPNSVQVSLEDIPLSLREVTDCGTIPELCPSPWDIYEPSGPITGGPGGPRGPRSA